MPFTSLCPHCRKTYSLKDDMLGRKVTCAVPTCKQVFTAELATPAAAGAKAPVSAPAPAAPNPAPAAAPPPPKPAARPPAPPAATAPRPPAAPVPAPPPAAPKVAPVPAPVAKAAATAEAAKPPAAPPKPPAPAKEPTKPPAKPTSPETPPVMDAETLAASALADEAPKQEEVAALDIPMQCPVCEHKWTAPRASAGKNVLCPECQHRTKVPEPKVVTVDDDWRRKKTNLPRGAKDNFEKLEGVQASEGQRVSVEALIEGGAIEENLEPLTMRAIWIRTGLAAAVAFAVVATPAYFWQKRTASLRDNRVEKALREFADPKNADARPPAAQVPLFTAVLHLGAGEYQLRHTPFTPETDLRKAIDQFALARKALKLDPVGRDADRKAVLDERHAVAGELALATLALGGTPEEVAQKTRIRWVPDGPDARRLRINESVDTVHEELRRALEILSPAEFEMKLPVARRLTRELVARKQPDLAGLLPKMMFSEAEQPEAAAVVALEMLRADRALPQPRNIAEALRGQLTPTAVKDAGGPGKDGKEPKKEVRRGPAVLPATSAPTLWQVVDPPVDKVPVLFNPPPAVGEVLDNPRVAAVCRLAFDGKADEALAMAKRPGKPEGQLRALGALAEWAPDPGPAVVAAAEIVDKTRGRKDVYLNKFVVYRLVQLGARAGGNPDAVKTLAEGIPDEGLRVWAKAEAARQRWADPKAPADDAPPPDLPTDPKGLRVGHAWGAEAFARFKTRTAGVGAAEDVAKDWPAGSVHPFGLLGTGLGLQD